MTGAEHYRAAEKALNGAQEGIAKGLATHIVDVAALKLLVGVAQAHATLALAAANGLNEAVAGMPEMDRSDWQQAAGHPLPTKDGDR